MANGVLKLDGRVLGRIRIDSKEDEGDLGELVVFAGVWSDGLESVAELRCLPRSEFCSPCL